MSNLFTSETSAEVNSVFFHAILLIKTAVKMRYLAMLPIRQYVFGCFLISLPHLLNAQTPFMSFPQHVKYHAGTILPSHITQKEMDDSVGSFYSAWKARYINDDSGPNQFYVWFEKRGNKQCVSEGQGYGMLIVALMAGFDGFSKKTYDGLFNYYKAHPSKYNNRLMAWAQTKTFSDIGQSSATDGDMDIAYSLILANAQWGSEGRVNYLNEAREIISAIRKSEINPTTLSVKISDAIEYDSPDYFDMRSSDFMPSHYRLFDSVCPGTGWNQVIDNNYKLFAYLQNTYSERAGLLPDFITHINTRARPAKPHYLESRYDGFYNYNACRVPWRIAADYIVSGDERSKKIVQTINHWIRETTQNNPDNISAGYSLAGDDLKSRHFEALSFITPFAVAAMADVEHQKWLNNLWDYIVHFNLDQFDYYDNTIKMINLIILSGNYWSPKR